MGTMHQIGLESLFLAQFVMLIYVYRFPPYVPGFVGHFLLLLGALGRGGSGGGAIMHLASV